jgi:hypothetical protein
MDTNPKNPPPYRPVAFGEPCPKWAKKCRILGLEVPIWARPDLKMLCLDFPSHCVWLCRRERLDAAPDMPDRFEYELGHGLTLEKAEQAVWAGWEVFLLQGCGKTQSEKDLDKV